jgi:hypothetical protein
MPLLFRKTHSVCLSAVRKNRYVILPVDFEEAWKVSCLELFATSHVIFIKTQLFLTSQQTVKRSDETHEFCEFSLWNPRMHLTMVTLFRSVVWLLLVR